MIPEDLLEKAEKYLQRLCIEIPTRRVGSRGNQLSTEMFAEAAASFGFQTESPIFECIDWVDEGSTLTATGESFETFVSPYSLGCQVSAPLVVASTVEALEIVDASDKVLLLRGDIAKEQLMPKNFPFYNPDHHKRVIHLLETKGAAAIVTATSRNPELAGGVYPFPLIEDGDFDIPSVYMTDKEGERLAKHAGGEISLEIKATRIPSTGNNVIARKGTDLGPRIVLCAHIDAKDNTPGALDNATGVVVLLLLAELLGSDPDQNAVEIVALNGEDHYSAQGQKEYVKRIQDYPGGISLAINIDVAGYVQGNTAFSLYDCPDEMAGLIQSAFLPFEDIIEGERWYQSDHMIFVQNQIPAIAITSDRFMELSTNITHTPKDNLDVVDREKLVSLALALRDLLVEINS